MQIEKCPDGQAADNNQKCNLSCMWVLVHPGKALTDNANVITT